MLQAYRPSKLNGDLWAGSRHGVRSAGAQESSTSAPRICRKVFKFFLVLEQLEGRALGRRGVRFRVRGLGFGVQGFKFTVLGFLAFGSGAMWPWLL